MKRSRRPRDIRRSCIEMSHGGPAKRSCRELPSGELGCPRIAGEILQRVPVEISHRGKGGLDIPGGLA